MTRERLVEPLSSDVCDGLLALTFALVIHASTLTAALASALETEMSLRSVHLPGDDDSKPCSYGGARHSE